MRKFPAAPAFLLIMAAPARTVDIMPAVLELAGVAPPAGMRGRSLGYVK